MISNGSLILFEGINLDNMDVFSIRFVISCLNFSFSSRMLCICRPSGSVAPSKSISRLGPSFVMIRVDLIYFLDVFHEGFNLLPQVLIIKKWKKLFSCTCQTDHRFPSVPHQIDWYICHLCRDHPADSLMGSDGIVISLHPVSELLSPIPLSKLRITFVLSLKVSFKRSKMLLFGLVSDPSTGV